MSDDDGGFDHPDDIPVTDADEIPEINSADDAVDGDEERKQRLIEKAEKIKERERAESEGKTLVDVGGEPSEEKKQANEAARDLLRKMEEDEDVPSKEELKEAFEAQLDRSYGDEDTNSDSDDDPDTMPEDTTTDEPMSEPDSTNTDSEVSIGQAGGDDESIFTEDEAEDLEDAAGQFELDPVEDIPDDFDYESQDTSNFGGYDTINIEHNDTVFKLEQPTGTKEDKFWAEIQGDNSLADMFDAMIRYSVVRPEDIGQRMNEENWTSFAKAGLATKCSAFLGLDALQDF